MGIGELGGDRPSLPTRCRKRTSKVCGLGRVICARASSLASTGVCIDLCQLNVSLPSPGCSQSLVVLGLVLTSLDVVRSSGAGALFCGANRSRFSSSLYVCFLWHSTETRAAARRFF